MISKKASVGNAIVEGTAIIYGESRIGDKSYIGGYSIIGYPSKETLEKMYLYNKNPAYEETRAPHYLQIGDVDIGNGAVIGSWCVIRSHVVIYERVYIGDRVRTGHHVLIREDSRVGDNTLIGSGTIVDGHVVIGSGVSIQSGVYIPSMVVIKDNVFIGPRVVFTNDKYPPSRRLVETIVEEGAVIGANSTIIAGVRIGKRAVVAAGSIVTRDVPDDMVVMGIPARVVMRRDEYEDKKLRYEKASKTHDL
ncbi:MAG: N-acetyltransferase [Desulfurococcaceae archaeon]|jgi:acetyltransferase-like isoleucine patch superfamily enzyme|nr:MAG: N-acetyltransferase [Desulfurococcaceae archaeon]